MKWFDKAIPLIGIILLSFVLGGVCVYYEWGPGEFVSNALRGKEAEKEQGESLKNIESSIVINRKVNRVISNYDRTKSYKGYTLLSNVYSSKALLVDMRGKIVHSWALPFSKAWKKAPHVKHPVPDKAIFWQRVYLYPNGDLLALYSSTRDTPYGYGLAKIDKNSKVIWTYDARTHHDINIGSDGNIYLLTHQINRKQQKDFPQIKPPVIEDSVVKLSAEGKSLVSVNLLSAFERSPYKNMLKSPLNGRRDGDYFHSNSVFVLPEGISYSIPEARAGMVLVSIRNQNLLAIIDLEEKRVIWAKRGPWNMQHQAEFLSNGNIVMFDNRGLYAEKKRRSRVIEYDPAKNTIVWSFDGAGKPFHSMDRGMQQLLPNGNYLILDSRSARVLEVTPDKKVAWNYKEEYPKDLPRGDNRSILTALRYSPESLPFLQEPAVP